MDHTPGIEKIVRKVAESEGIYDYDLTIKKGSEKGDGFLGEIFTADVVEKETGKTLNLLAKASIGNEKMREAFPIGAVYENEILFYADIFPQLDKFQRKIGLDNPFDSVAKYYDSLIHPGEEIIIMENLKISNFELFDKKVPLDEEHITKIFKEYGKFHALSLALKRAEKDTYRELEKKACNVLVEMVDKSKFDLVLEGVFNYIRDLFDSDEDTKEREILDKYARNAGEYLKYVSTAHDDYTCVLHGDCWSNNMLFRYEEVDNRKCLKDMRIIDWQMLCIGSPVMDLSYSLYSGTTKELFSNLKKYLKIYHNSLTDTLLALNSDFNFPFETLVDHWKKYAKYGFMMSMMVLKIKFTEQENIKDHSDFKDEDYGKIDKVKMKEFIDTECDKKGLSDRIRDIICQMAEFDAI